MASSDGSLSGLPLHRPAETDAISDARADAHKGFHFALVSACDGEWRLWICGLLDAQSERDRNAPVCHGLHPRDIAAKHVTIVSATSVRDVLAACAALRDHLLRTRRILVAGDADGPVPK